MVETMVETEISRDERGMIRGLLAPLKSTFQAGQNGSDGKCTPSQQRPIPADVSDLTVRDDHESLRVNSNR
jgi:hypothetical protein